MKNIFIYYVLILVPIGPLVWLSVSNIVNANLFAFLLLFYALIYRTYIDGKRLADKKIIPKKDIWKMIIPGYHLKYFTELYLK